MNSIIYIGIDVHKESYTICSYRVEEDEAKYVQKIKADYKMVFRYLDQMRRHYEEDVDFICGYEAGPIGYKLYRRF